MFITIEQKKKGVKGGFLNESVGFELRELIA